MQNDHPEVRFGKTGILLINLGTPDSTSWWDIRKYLKEFLSDRRVIEVNPILWQIILNLFILTLDHLKQHTHTKNLEKRVERVSFALFYKKPGRETK